MSTTNRRRVAVAAAALMTLFGAGAAGCASGEGASEEAPKAQASPQRKAEEGLVGILVAGRPVTVAAEVGRDAVRSTAEAFGFN
ncbi:hypothetical protein V7793_00040 [Streptomyces sp. KLMMK]|uniref:hypothetical protein n=1 Tax=Streptomyces sp. KLMMK TaxID=3109353 RepID=UPI002FFE4F7F